MISRTLRRAGAAAVVTATVSVSSAEAASTPVITDPYTNASSQHATAVEPDTFAFGSTLVVTSQVGRFFDGGASGTGVATSTDGGATFKSGPLPGLTTQPPLGGGIYARTTDPAVAYDARHNVWMISSLVLDARVTGVGVVVNRSTDGGLTWGSPVNVAVAGLAHAYDKNWVACDNHPSSRFYGRCYHTWDDFGAGDRILMSTSPDGGLTWSAPAGTASGTSGLGGQPVVQPNGTVIVPAANAFESEIIAFRSTDGGATWGDEVVVSRVSSHLVAGTLRSGPLPSSDVGSNGRVYTVWQDCRFRAGCAANDIVLSTSDDGVTWAPVRRVPIDAAAGAADHFIPGLGVQPDTTGRLGLTYYSYDDAACGAPTTPACALKVGFVQSDDGGGTWSAPQTLAGPFSVAWTANSSQGRMVGDYISTSWVGGKAFGAFAVANAPAGSVLDQKIHVPAGGVSATTFPSVTTRERSFSHNGATAHSVARSAH